MSERELKAPISLCDTAGELNPDAVGWSRTQIFDCNLRGRLGRKKRWNYWAVTNEDCLFSVTVSSLDYAGLVFLYFYDFHTKEFIERTFISPFGRGCHLGSKVSDPASFTNSKITVTMEPVEAGTRIMAVCSDFGGKRIEADFTVVYPEDYDTLNVVIPWDQSTFQFTSKHEGMSTDGFVRLDDKTYRLASDTSFAVLDYGRGIWPRKVVWNWANVSGIAEGHRIGINLGAGWTDGTGMTENAVVVDGRMTKLSEEVTFTYDQKDFMKPWRIRTTETDSVDLMFHPDYERIAKSNLLLVRSELHQVIGHVTGVLRLHDNHDTVIRLDGLIGCTEDHMTIW